MSAQEKEVWDKRAQKDKARYEVEKAMYKGPWKIPANKRTPKDPAAPKRPMSAFLAFSNKRRAALKRVSNLKSGSLNFNFQNCHSNFLILHSTGTSGRNQR
jgi:hypothetical protein